VFTLRLPIVEAAPRVPAPAPPAPTVRDTGSTGPSLDGVSVLVVCSPRAEGDEQATVVLRERGAEVIVASEPEQAVDLVRRLRPDVLLSCPNGEGDQGLIRAVREIAPERGGLTPAALLAGAGTTEERMRSLLAGYQAHIPASVEPPELASVVASLAGRTREFLS
jgi:CheY-like chemotaxis protein